MLKEDTEMFARPGLPSFEYVRAYEPSQVVSILQEHGEKAKLLMGGTDLFPNLRDGVFHPRVVVDVKQIPGMRDIVFSPSGDVIVGAAVTMNTLASHPDVRMQLPLLADAAGSVASYQIRNRATLGGNLCNASPCADTSPATLVLDARFILQGPGGERSLPAGEFFLGPGQTALQPGEFMAAVRFPPTPAGAVASYQKLGRCRSGDLSLVGVSVVGSPDASTGSGYRFRIGLGSVAPTPIRALQAEELLASSAPGERAFVPAAQKTQSAAAPITDVRGTASYQLAMVHALTIRALREVWAKLKETD
jgi:carbon-monoxide dehydrogenase medium subunit